MLASPARFTARRARCFFSSLPIIDVGPLVARHVDGIPLRVSDPDVASVASALDAACSNVGFFYVTGTERAVSPSLLAAVRDQARGWFSNADGVKQRVALGAAPSGFESPFRGYQASYSIV